MTPATVHAVVGEYVGEAWRVATVSETDVTVSGDFPTITEATDHALIVREIVGTEATVHVLPAHTCPRCAGGIPNTEWRGRYVGAISRRFADVEICSDCGTAEAFHDFYGTHAQEMRWWIADD